MSDMTAGKFGLSRVTTYLSGQILLHVVPGNKDPTFEPPTFQLQVLPLSPEQVGLFLCLVDDIV